MRRLSLWLVFVASLTISFPALCQDTLAPDPSPTPPLLGLTVSGGVSLGAFEAGYLYYLFETLKLNPGLAEPRIFTGASAGGANALFSLLSSCSGPEPSPEKSLFYRTWIPVGLKQLFSEEDVTARALFTQAPLREALNRIGETWDLGLDAKCDTLIGLSTTRVTAAKVELIKDRVTLARTEAKFVVRIRGRGPGKPPIISNFVGERELMQRPLLPEEDDGNISFASLRQVLLASAAFPLAFEPVPVAHCTAQPVEGGTKCTASRAEITLFVDGGVFDNQPLRLGVQLAQQGLIGEGAARRIADVPTASGQKLREDILFVYVDPAIEVLPTVDASEGPADDATVSYLLYLFEQLVDSSRSKELQVLLEDDPDVTKQITATHTYFMPLSDALGSFFGFFEKDFRIHDFYLGMHSAHRWFSEVMTSWRPNINPVYPEEKYAGLDPQLIKSWAPYRCMRAAFDGTEPIQSCKNVPQSLRAGIQTSLDRIYARCSQLAQTMHAEGKTVPATAHNHCRRAFLGDSPPLLPGMTNRHFKLRENESAMDYELRRLVRHGFEFRDMNIPSERASEAKRYIAQRIGSMVRALGTHQKSGLYRAVLPVGARLLSQSMAYVPPYAAWHLMMGRGLEWGYSGALWDNTRFKWLRGALSLELDGLLTLVSEGSGNALKLTPMLGFEVELTRFSNWQYQTRLGLRGGFGFSTRDRFLARFCNDGVLCSRARGEAYVAFVLYQLLRLQLGFAVYPPMHIGGRNGTHLGWDYSIQPRLGVEIDRP
jgi:predicted acylesterase/phospholipase RssA